ncbi:MAG TPA: xanthine dehydrogenase family protein molybdopterin-binding subunit, partial [Solirubrobacteraceae bacterium]
HFVRSPVARARITGLRAPGSVTVLTAADLADLRPPPVGGPPGVELADAPHPLLAAGEVRYAGQAVAAVVAETRALAEDAAELVEVDYEELPAVVDPGAAGERLTRWSRSGGDVDGAFAAAAHVVRAHHEFPRVVAAPIEPRGALAVPGDRAAPRGAPAVPGDRELTLWCSAQDTHRQLAGLAHVLGRPEDTLRVVLPDVGGAFGSKGPLAPEAAVVAAAALRLGRPVKWVEERMENFLASYQGRGMRADVELALDADGRMLALRARILADLGAYLLGATAIPPHTMGMLMCGCYRFEAASVEVEGARTDKVPTGPYRGAGRPEAAYALERTVDRAARELGLDPVELRLRNLVRSFPHRTPLGFTYDSGDFTRCLDTALELLGRAPVVTDGRRIGRGVALYVERAGGQWEAARATLQPDARVVIGSSSFPHGQGHDTTFAQIAADRLGVEIGDVVMRFGDSGVVPRGTGTFGSRSLAVGGSAVALAAEELRERCRALAARRLEVEQVEPVPGGFAAPDGRSVTLRELAAGAGGLEAFVRFDSELVFSSGAHAATVAIDPDTGKVEVLQLVAVDDAGRIVNPLLAEGQVIGGAVQGLGAVLGEEMVHDEDGQPRAASFMDYGLPTAADVPPVQTAFVESPTPHNPLGAKGIGEGGTIGAPAAVASAVSDALGGAQLQPPFTPERVWRVLRER